MGHTNSTTNYNLTQFIGSDKPAWLEDYNGDMLAIDSNMNAISDVADAAKTEADQNTLDIATVTATATAAAARSSAAISNFAETYDPTETYAVGDYVTYEHLTYKCTTAIIIPEAFDGSHWARITVDSELTAVNVDIDGINNELDKSITVEGAGFFVIGSTVSCVSDSVSGTLAVEGNITTAQQWITVGTINRHPSIQIDVPLINRGSGASDGILRIQTNGEIRLFTLSTGYASRAAVIAYSL